MTSRDCHRLGLCYDVLETVNDVRVANTKYPIVVRVIGITLKNSNKCYIDFKSLIITSCFFLNFYKLINVYIIVNFFNDIIYRYYSINEC